MMWYDMLMPCMTVPEPVTFFPWTFLQVLLPYEQRISRRDPMRIWTMCRTFYMPVIVVIGLHDMATG